jgi:hypothetical protein
MKITNLIVMPAGTCATPPGVETHRLVRRNLFEVRAALGGDMTLSFATFMNPGPG